MDIPHKTLLLALALCMLYAEVQPARILMIPGPHYSHVNFFSTAGRALHDDGHEVYVLTILKYGPNVEKHGLTALLHDDAGNDMQAEAEKQSQKIIKGNVNMLDIFRMFLPLMSQLCKDVQRNELLMNQIRDLKFDLVINDATMFYTCFYAIPYRFGLRYMSMTALHEPWTFGVSGLPSIEPSQMTSNSQKMSFFQRLMNLVPFTLLSMNPVSFMYSKEHMKEFAPHRPYKSLKQLVAESEITLVNHEVICVGYPRVSAPNYIFIGGSSAKKAGPLPHDLQMFADGAKEGLIILSFGSLKALHVVWKSLKPTMMNVLSKLPQRAIIQYGLDDVDDAPKNVKLVKWLPQNDLLGHPNTKLFITHGGNNGQLEAVYHGVPVLTMPFTGDQQFNSIQAQSRGFGLVLDRLTMTESDLYDTLTEMINNKKYSEKIKKCSEITKSMPSSHETTVFWVNHILRFGGDHLRSPAVDMPMYQILMLDVYAFLALVVILVVICITCACRCMCRACKKSGKQKSE